MGISAMNKTDDKIIPLHGQKTDVILVPPVNHKATGRLT